jgi:hypothetical protein
MGPTTIANVNPKSLYITCLIIDHGLVACDLIKNRKTNAGTAGVMLDFSEVENVLSSFSSTVFSLEMMRLVAMMMNLALGVT